MSFRENTEVEKWPCLRLQPECVIPSRSRRNPSTEGPENAGKVRRRREMVVGSKKANGPAHAAELFCVSGSDRSGVKEEVSIAAARRRSRSRDAAMHTGVRREGGDAIGHSHRSDALCTRVVIVATPDVRLGLAAPRPPKPGYFKSSSPCPAFFPSFHDPPHPRTTLFSTSATPSSSSPRTATTVLYS